MSTFANLKRSAAKRVALPAVRWGLSLPDRPIQALIQHTGLRDVIRRDRIDVVLDVGANTGQFAEGLRNIGFRGRILSFEPVQREFEAASLRMRGDPLWRGLKVALGDADGEAAINVVPSLTVMNSLLASITPSRPVETERVDIRRLDGLLPDILPTFRQHRILLKMDTQGYDLRCFAGAEGCLDSIVSLFSELSVVPLYVGSPHYLECLRRYEAAGYDLINLSVESRRDEFIQEMNCLMRRREAGRAEAA